VHIHPPKIEIFDLAAMTNTDPKGLVRAVDEYRVEPFGLYVARSMPDHPKLSYLESWLLPEVGLRITDFRYRAGYERDQDFYIDIALVEPGPTWWRTTDYYLDIVVRAGRDLDVLDTDELLAATDDGLLDRPTAEWALRTTYRAVAGIAEYGYDLAAWLATMDIRLAWQRR
jgi:predicted RNA-binding protein associated with RNAse of E/G family